ncbi:SDR family NAD(P)-dependent oxidoreductase [Secundilactobacillus paracollinoides]|uniref:Short-chain dehydrogenase n=2 Tax=Secundilactobacillus paracollinoides TaxID=240427 RepID=A0A1B2IVY9_9LACO|nr:SDR family NAD(P)-dependent oxidoreductase [Secundilactobacillus paracollinoides]ANZ60382.1 hypothetical protein AYR61_02795 [Secundilactobacillus paracollinoides]ANZ66210.1 hypothetical protein AYR63_03000 [Secundilactobacillus paracollinoides]
MKQPKVENKIVLISGGTSGVGKAAAISLAKAGAEVIILGHRQSRADAAVAEIQRRSNNPLIWAELCDLTLHSDIKALHERLIDQNIRLDALINAAGGVTLPQTPTAEGVNTSYALNYAATYWLTTELHDRLRKGARVLNVLGLALVAKNQPVLIPDDPSCAGLNGSQVIDAAFSNKMLFTQALAGRYKRDGITINCFNPGLIRTGMGADASAMAKTLRGLYNVPAKSESKLVAKLALDPRYTQTGILYNVWGHPVKMPEAHYTVQKRRDLLAFSETL